jgi:hypothetical protein
MEAELNKSVTLFERTATKNPVTNRAFAALALLITAILVTVLAIKLALMI